MLFLFPALSFGIEGVEEAIRASYRWILGNNELGVPMWQNDPFLVYRSIRRRLPILNRAVRARGGKFERLLDRGSTFVRASTRSPAGAGPDPTQPRLLEINRECRSYEIGWTVFAWAGVTGFEEFTEAKMWEPVS